MKSSKKRRRLCGFFFNARYGLWLIACTKSLEWEDLNGIEQKETEALRLFFSTGMPLLRNQGLAGFLAESGADEGPAVLQQERRPLRSRAV
jgi:hypothetical protein